MPDSSPQPRRIFKGRVELFVGIGMGLVFACVLYYFFQGRAISRNENDYSLQSRNKIDTIRGENYTLEIKQKNEVQIKEYNAIIDEKINSFNDRMGDFYLSLSLVIVLLLFIVGGVYFRTDALVNKHMIRNYDEYKRKIVGMTEESQELLSKIQANAELSEQAFVKEKEKEEQIPTPKEAS